MYPSANYRVAGWECQGRVSGGDSRVCVGSPDLTLVHLPTFLTRLEYGLSACDFDSAATVSILLVIFSGAVSDRDFAGLFPSHKRMCWNLYPAQSSRREPAVRCSPPRSPKHLSNRSQEVQENRYHGEER